ncbi:hypothetical protein [Roseibium polysiphoniae]|uniref:hypothetical protein n=1 Tax=Roseibium polysiphoniae TaxID=2571221 RepID=UPI003297091D
MRYMAWLMALMLGCFAVPAWADIVVVAASGDTDHLPGDILAPTTVLTLPGGARVTILSQNGKMRVIDGPFEGSLEDESSAKSTSPVPASWDALKVLLGDPDARSNVLGASRNLDGAFRVPASIWHVSIDSSGPRCVRQSELTLARRDASASAVVSVRSSEGRITDISWPKDQTTLTLPSDFAADGRLAVSIDDDLRTLTLNTLPETLNEALPGSLLTWFSGNNCKRQAIALIQRIHDGVEVN